MSNKNFTYICPHCKKTLNNVGEAQEGVILYHYSFESGDWEQTETENEEHISYYCPVCGLDFPDKLENKIYNIISGNKEEEDNDKKD